MYMICDWCYVKYMESMWLIWCQAYEKHVNLDDIWWLHMIRETEKGKVIGSLPGYDIRKEGFWQSQPDWGENILPKIIWASPSRHILVVTAGLRGKHAPQDNLGQPVTTRSGSHSRIEGKSKIIWVRSTITRIMYRGDVGPLPNIKKGMCM